MINELQFGEAFTIEIPTESTILCDMDGTLIDTDYANYLSYRLAVIETTHGAHDIELTDERLSREVLKKRLPSITTEQLNTITDLKTKYFFDFLSDTQLNNALADLIINNHIKNTIALVTCSREKRALDLLKYYNLLEYFTRLICCDSLPQGGSSNKHENAIRLMRARKETVFIFENDNTSIKQAVSSGVPKNNIYRIITKKGQT